MILVIDDIEVKVAQSEPLVSSSVNVYEAEFRFDKSWDGYTKTVVFDTARASVAVLLTDDRLVIPWEVLQSSGGVKIGIYGTKGDKVRPTLWSKIIPIAEGAGGGDDPTEPSPVIVSEDVARALETIGDTEAALDAIIALQESIIGGAA